MSIWTANHRRLVVVLSILLTAGAATLMWLSIAAAPSFAEVKAAYIPSDAYLLDRHGDVLDSVRVNFDVRREEWISLRDISPALISATIHAEDQRYWTHHGVDWRSVLGAVRDQLFLHRARGASTLTMQLASLLAQQQQQSRSRGLIRKILQVRLALALERQWTKAQILEAYFNLVNFRGELQGISAAARLLTAKTPVSLSPSESLVMASLLPAPNANVELVSRRACARAASSRVAVPCAALRQTAIAMLTTREPTDEQGIAPQLAHTLLKEAGQRITTTLEASIQRAALASLRNRLGDLAAKNVRDGAVIVVDNASGEVLAYVGSGGPNSSAKEVDGVRARRQAGSTLKPFLYELAIERDYLTAASLLNDSSLNLDTSTGVYIPQDYDHDFKGLVSVRTALGNSLNVPAVRTLVLTGVEAFRSRLHDLGYEGITESGEFYGYSLALGSAEVSLWEQAQAYRALAQAGQWSQLHLIANDSAATSKQLLPAAASFIVSNILSDRAARSITFGLDNYLNTSFWSAAKTGTSKDMRDNWCIGFSRQFTVAVWVGNFEGDSMHEVSGVTGAAPIWHDVMLALHKEGAPPAPAAPSGLKEAVVRFSPAVEYPRRELFLDRVSTSVTATASQGEIAHIESPANGMVIAIDPDIPTENQRVPISAKGIKPGMRLKLNGSPLSDGSQALLWAPKTGSYRLALEDATGHTVDQILFTVR